MSLLIQFSVSNMYVINNLLFLSCHLSWCWELMAEQYMYLDRGSSVPRGSWS